MLTTFINVTISIEAPTSEEAYTRLCELLDGKGLEYTTDVFVVEGVNGENVGRDTSELFPRD